MLNKEEIELKNSSGNEENNRENVIKEQQENEDNQLN